MKKIFYTKHALERMVWRKVSKDVVEEVVRNPDFLEEVGSKLIASKFINHEKVIVVYIPKGGGLLVITVMTR